MRTEPLNREVIDRAAERLRPEELTAARDRHALPPGFLPLALMELGGPRGDAPRGLRLQPRPRTFPGSRVHQRQATPEELQGAPLVLRHPLDLEALDREGQGTPTNDIARLEVEFDWRPWG